MEKNLTPNVDLTPTWTDIVGAMLAVYRNESASYESLRAIEGEFYRMANLADLYATFERGKDDV